MDRKPLSAALWAAAAVMLLVLLGFAGLMFFLLFGLFLEPNIYYSCIVLFASLAVLAAGIALPWKKPRKFTLLGGAALLLAWAIALCACLGCNAYRDSLTLVDKSNIDTDLYLAFDPDSDIPRLGKEASLRFPLADDLPVVDGAAAFFPLYSAFVEATYPAEIPALNHPGSPYRYHNTIDGYSALISGEADILFAFGPDSEQSALAEQAGVELELIPLGREGFVFFANRENPVDGLTQEEIRGIYSGKITNWREVGGKNEKILPYQRNAGSGSQTALVQFMGETPLAEPPKELVSRLMSGIIEAVSDYRNHRGAMGFSFRQYAEEIVANENIKLFAVDGVAPTEENMQSGAYPVMMPFYMVVRKGCRTEKMDALIAWARSEEGQSLVKAAGFATNPPTQM